MKNVANKKHVWNCGRRAIVNLISRLNKWYYVNDDDDEYFDILYCCSQLVMKILKIRS